MFERAASYEIQFRKAIAEATLLTRENAAKMLACSLPELDRRVRDGELEVIHQDRRPRFRLTELQRSIEVHSSGGRSSRGKHD